MAQNTRRVPKPNEEERNHHVNIVERARLAYSDLQEILIERERNFRYRTGRQWSDVMEDPDNPGEYITEEQFIIRQGRLPAKQNLIGKTVRNLKGQFRTNYPDPVAYGRTRNKAQAGEVMTSALQYVLDTNEANELDALNIEELTLSATFGWKIGYKWQPQLNRKEVKIDNLDMTRFFYNVDSNDIRNEDIKICGELHDVTVDEVISMFGFTSKDRDRVLELFQEGVDDLPNYRSARWKDKLPNFEIPQNDGDLRLIEVWIKEFDDVHFLHDPKEGSSEMVDKAWFIQEGVDPELVEELTIAEIVEMLNASRVEYATMQGVNPMSVPLYTLEEKYEPVWNVYYLTPAGNLLHKRRTPYDHEEHPYVFRRHMIDGKPLPLVSSIIDQQRHVNRLISMIDASLGRSLKNVMMIDIKSIPAEYKNNYQDYLDDMVKMGNTIFYTSADGTASVPREISSNSIPAGSMELLSLQSELLKDLSAVNDAMQGKEPQSGTPASLYAQQTINASITNKDMFDFYFSALRIRNRKVVQVIKQFYDEPRYIKVSGTGFTNSVEAEYDPSLVRDVDFDVVIGESQNTLAYRQVVDTELKEFLNAQLISFEEYLKTTSMPYADKLLQVLQNRQEKGMGMDPAMMNQMMQAQTGQIQQGGGQPQELQMPSTGQNIRAN